MQKIKFKILIQNPLVHIFIWHKSLGVLIKNLNFNELSNLLNYFANSCLTLPIYSWHLFQRFPFEACLYVGGYNWLCYYETEDEMEKSPNFSNLNTI